MRAGRRSNRHCSFGAVCTHSQPPVTWSDDGTGLAVLSLEAVGIPRSDPRLSRGVAWLSVHQDAASGRWTASSVNKARDPATDIGKFMSDAATSYAAMALLHVR